MKKQKNILICPLNWGLGHATRCIPIIQELINAKHRVIIASEKAPLALLKKEFPNLPTVFFPGYDIQYPKTGKMSFKILLQIPKILKAIKTEHLLLDNLISDHNIDLVISDNRYGAWSNRIPAVFITHQLSIRTPIDQKMLEKINQKYISNFKECWIPDYKDSPSLSGDLSHNKSSANLNYQFIGPLSRFKKTLSQESIYDYDFMAIVSGPEPQRTLFEKLIIKQVESSNLKGVLVRGLPNNKTEIEHPKIKIVNHLETDDFLSTVQKSKIIVARSGYSTIMDLIHLNKRGILIPTPGQTEQEYLAKYHFNQSNFYTQKQADFNLEKAMIKVMEFSPNIYPHQSLKLKITSICNS